MTTDEAYVEGFVKRASEYGFSAAEAVEILKQAMEMPMAGKVKPPAPKIPNSIKGNANDIANKPRPIVPLPKDEQF